MSGFSVNTNGAALLALRTYSAAQTGLDGIRERVATGLAVVGPKDDASDFAVAQGVRADLKAWSAVETQLGATRGLLSVTLAVATQISNLLGDLQQKVIEYFAADADGQAIIENGIDDLLNNIDAAAESATFNGANLLTSDDAGVTLPAPADEGQNFTLSGGGSSLTHNLGTNGGHLRVNYAASGSGGGSIRLVYNGSIVDIGPANAAGTLEFDYPASPTTNVTLELTGAPGLAVDYSFALDFDQETGATGAYSVLRDIQGGAIDVQHRSMLADDIHLRPALLGSANTALAQIRAARREIDQDLGYYGAKLQEVDGAIAFTRNFQDALGEGLGAMVDADLGREQAALAAAETRQSLATQSLSLANQHPNVVLNLLPKI
jgi:flagellin